jgi:hypothetical protein
MAKLDTIEVLQLNLNKCYQAQIELMQKIKSMKTFIGLIQEPYCYKTKACLIPKNLDKFAFSDSPRTRSQLLGASTSKDFDVNQQTLGLVIFSCCCKAKAI